MLNLARRLAFNHATFGPALGFADFLDTVSKSGAAAVGVWTDRLDGMSPQAAGALVRDHGLAISGVNRGGFFTGATARARQDAIDETRRQVEAAAALGADTLVIVPGGLVGGLGDLLAARQQVREGLADVSAFARDHGIRLALEPFNPALTSARSVINTLDLALDTCEGLGEHVGVLTDIYHVWWDPNIRTAIERARGRIFGHHLCDWKRDTADVFNDRGLMGDGVGDAAGLTAAVMAAGYSGWMEIEIFSKDDLWTMEPGAISALCLERALRCLTQAEALAGALHQEAI